MPDKRRTQEKKTAIFVKVEKPKAMRKAVLGSALDTIMLLKKYSEIKSARHEKLTLLKKLRTECNIIKRLFLQLEKDGLNKGIYTEKVKLETKGKKIKTTQEDSEISKLRSELEDIDKRLNSL